MKFKTLFLAGLTLLLIGISSNDSQAQARRGETVVSVGAGYSLQYGYTIPDNESERISEYNASPIYNFSVDFASVDRLSMGIAASYQSIHSSAVADPYMTYNVQPVMEEELNILNVGMRIHVHFMPKVEKVDIYAGGRAGFSFRDYTNNFENIDMLSSYYAEPILEDEYNFPTFQFGFGMRYYATENIGLNLEGMVGNGPYMVLLGLNFKFGGEGVAE